MKIFVDKSYGKGFGVFAAENIKQEDIIEESPVLVLTEEDTKIINQTVLENYGFIWGGLLTVRKNVNICYHLVSNVS